MESEAVPPLLTHLTSLWDSNAENIPGCFPPICLEQEAPLVRVPRLPPCLACSINHKPLLGLCWCRAVIPIQSYMFPWGDLGGEYFTDYLASSCYKHTCVNDLIQVWTWRMFQHPVLLDECSVEGTKVRGQRWTEEGEWRRHLMIVYHEILLASEFSDTFMKAAAVFKLTVMFCLSCFFKYDKSTHVQ